MSWKPKKNNQEGISIKNIRARFKAANLYDYDESVEKTLTIYRTINAKRRNIITFSSPNTKEEYTEVFIFNPLNDGIAARLHSLIVSFPKVKFSFETPKAYELTNNFMLQPPNKERYL